MMKPQSIRRLGLGFGAALLTATGCGPDQEAAQPEPQAPTLTNRLEVPPDVVNNLGITFESATRGRLGRWRTVSGELIAPESHRWELRAPARGRIVAVTARWQRVERGAEVARLMSPAVQELQRGIERAIRTFEQARREVESAQARLRDSEAVLGEATAFEEASRRRLGDLQAIGDEGNALTAREVLEARATVTTAAGARLDAAIARDELTSRVASKQLEADQAESSVEELLRELAVVTGSSAEELRSPGDDGPAWRSIDTLALRAPADGIVVEVLVAQGEVLDRDAPIVRLLDPAELRFRGRVPEGDAGVFAAAQRVLLDFPSSTLPRIETSLLPTLPIADPTTRMLQIEAVVPSPEGRLAHGMSALAQVLVEEGRNEEVLIPERCIVFDGLEAIVFKRDPGDPNVVIRTPIEMGRRAAGQVEVLAGVLEGDELVADGLRQLERTGLGKPPEGGHFHADGTFHTDHK